jgi:hypothetical protein
MLSGAPPVHAPEPSHVDAVVQRLAPLQLVPAGAGVYVTPVAGLQEPMRQGFDVSITGGVPATHEPLPLQVERPEHWSPPHVVPALAGSAGLHVPAPSQSGVPPHVVPTPHAVPAASGVAAWHVPLPLHVGADAHDEATPHVVPALNGTAG